MHLTFDVAANWTPMTSSVRRRAAVDSSEPRAAMPAPQPARVDCADEPIRVPGAIQPHGWLIAIEPGTDHVVAYSENWQALTGAAPGAAQGESIRSIAASLLPRTGVLPEGEAPAAICTIDLGGRALDVTVHRSAALVILEFEPAAPQAGTQAPIYSLARHLLPRLQGASSVLELVSLAVSEMKRLTGFGRCMAYRFDEAGHGEVLAESLDPGYDAYAGHRFPAMDIPAQARELYRLNHIRLIPDANYRPVALHFVDPAWNGRTLDLSFASLRSVSPVHLEYMRNMGTLASMSVSIVVRGQLWGLISCHDHAPRHLAFQSRVACEHLGRLLSLQIEAKEDNAAIATGLELKKLTLEIVSHLADSDSTLQHLVDQSGPLLGMARAGGAAVIFEDQCWTTGSTPPPDQVVALARWIAERRTELYQSDSLHEEREPGTQVHASAAGVLAISLSQVHRHVILWFRPEIVQTIQWAGEPRKESGDGIDLHPRRSFATWEQLVRGHSLPWAPTELAGVLELRQALLRIVLRHAQERAEGATELDRLNKELEAFSYTVSHDLRAPMRHISAFVDLVLETEGTRLSQRAHGYLAQVQDASAFAVRLVDALLDFSRMARSSLNRSAVDTELMVDDLVRELALQENGRRIEWEIERPLPPLWGDPFLIQVAVRNLFSNALKYTRGRETARIRVSGLSSADGAGLEVSDNGVGFQMRFVDKLFGVFQRLHRAEDFEGTGIGLANVRRIVERHGGTAWAQGEPGVGATFGFTILANPGVDADRLAEADA